MVATLPSSPSLGIDPITAIMGGAKVLDFIGSAFGGPSAEDIARAQAAAAAAQRRQLMIAGGLVGGALLVVLLLRRRAE
jgi:hypothetical protein